MNPTRRGAIAGTVAVLAATTLPPAVAAPVDVEQHVRAILTANVRKAEIELEKARRRADQPDRVSDYGLYLQREELRLFNRGEGSWRVAYRLPMAPGARDDLDEFRRFDT